MVSKRLMSLRAIGADEWLSVLFAVWFLLTVLTPEDVYRTFFHALIYPLTLLLLLRRNMSVVAAQDRFILLFLAFCGYAAVTTWFVGGGPEDRDFQASRWALESALGMLAFFFWAHSTRYRPRAWGRWILVVALAGSVAGLITVDPELLTESRAEGLGAMAHPIQAASIVSMFLAVGLFLMLFRPQPLGSIDIALMSLAVSIVWFFVAATLSRGPLVALTLYLMVLVVVLCFRQKQIRVLVLLGVAFGLLAVLIDLLVGLPQLFDHLVSRGGSYRVEIWSAYLNYPPESILFGNGLGFDFRRTEAANMLQLSSGLDIAHPHNIWLGAFSETGLIGLALQGGLLTLPVIAVFRSKLAADIKLHLQAILGLFVLLTFSDEFTLLISVRAIWLFGWLPLILVWVWASQGQLMAAAPNEQGRVNS